MIESNYCQPSNCSMNYGNTFNAIAHLLQFQIIWVARLLIKHFIFGHQKPFKMKPITMANLIDDGVCMDSVESLKNSPEKKNTQHSDHDAASLSIGGGGSDDDVVASLHSLCALIRSIVVRVRSQ